MAKILIVEDDARSADFVRSHLQVSGHECMTVPDGTQAIEAAKQGPVDLVLLDVMMPGGVSGFEVCRRMRADAELYNMPILIVSAMSSEEEVMHGLAQGADDYITKPFSIQNLIQRVEALLRTSPKGESVDELTQMPNANAMKREVQHRVSRQEAFALVSAELLHLRELAYKCGADARAKAVRHLGRAILRCGEDVKASGLLASHMGGGFFAAIIDAELARPFCEILDRSWVSHMPGLYSSIGWGKAYEEAANGKNSPDRVPMLEPLICATARHRHDTLSSKELFEILMKIRTNAIAARLPGIHIDRRA